MEIKHHGGHLGHRGHGGRRDQAHHHLGDQVHGVVKIYFSYGSHKKIHFELVLKWTNILFDQMNLQVEGYGRSC